MLGILVYLYCCMHCVCHINTVLNDDVLSIFYVCPLFSKEDRTLFNGEEQKIFWPKFGHPNFLFVIFTLLDVRYCCKLSLYAISRKPNDSNSRKCRKFFFKNVASSVTRYHGQLSPCIISDKTDDAILRKLIDEWTN